MSTWAYTKYMISTICKKGVQAMNYFARKKDGKINKMKAIKLVYFADRYHLRKYGRPVIGDIYWAMKFGPVGSHTLSIGDLSVNDLDKDCLKYAKEYLAHQKGDEKSREILSKKEVDLNVFSQSDIEALEGAYKEFSDKDEFELAEITHNYPEWAKFKTEITSGAKKRMLMDYMDFFKDPKDSNAGLFIISEDHLSLSRENFLENKNIEKVLS